MSDPIENADTLAPSGVASPDGFDTLLPRLANRYQLLGLLGSGGMGAVYRVRDTELGEVVALKMLRPELMNDESALARFRDEVRLARRVTHRNVARTFDIGEHEGAKFLTMELVEGRSLASLIGERGALPVDDAIGIAESICAALEAAHAAAVVHRDLKPENVLIAKDDRVVVTDFGIAHALDASRGATAVVGTPAYMAPEQLDPRANVDQRADLYALGALVFEMLTGERAWKGDAPMALLAARLVTQAPPNPRSAHPEISESLGAVVMRCMSPTPADRFGSAAAVARALRSADALSPSPALPPPRHAPRPMPSATTVAVLPLRNDGPPADDYIADGLSDDLIDTLSMTRGLLVRPRGVVARFKGQRDAAQEIGRELGVQVVVEGSLRRVGEAIRIGVRLIGTADDFQLWARRFDAKVNDLFAVSDSAAQAIAQALTTELPSHERASSNDPAAIELYLRARQAYWNSSATNAAELFERALELEPSDPKIVAGCAIAYARMIFFGEGPREATVARGRELTERAVVLAPELGDVWVALASFRLNTGDPIGAAHALGAGLTHAPNSAMLQDWLGRLLVETGSIDEGVVRLEIAVGLDPTLLSARFELARAHALRGEWDASDAALDAVEAPEQAASRDALRARIALWRGVSRQLVASQPYMNLYARALELRALTAEQRTYMQERAQAASARMRPMFLQRNADLLSVVGDVDAALAAVEEAVKSDLIDLAWIDRCQALAPLRTDPRWEPLRTIVAERAKRILDGLRRDPPAPPIA